MPRTKIADFQSSGRFACYIRVSTAHQADSGLGLKAQLDNCLREASRLKLAPIEEGYQTTTLPQQGCFVDSGTSAFTVMLAKRNAGARLLAALEPGDTVIVSRIDRAFRNVRDFIVVSGHLAQSGVRLVVCSPRIDLDSATGKAQAQLLSVVAEWESSRKGERISAAIKAKKNRDSTSKDKTISRETEVSLDSDYRPPSPITPAPAENKQEAGRVFMYIRCSHRDSTESGLGLLHQTDVTRAHALKLLEANNNLKLESIFTDPSVSASTSLLRKRPAGKKMDDSLMAGDHVVFSSLDRGFRNVQDMASTFENWTKRGVHIHLVEEGFSLDDPAGKMLAGIIILFAQMEAELASDRSKEARAQLVAKGRYTGGSPPPFWTIYNSHGTKKLVVNRRKLVAARLIRAYIRNGLTAAAAIVRSEVLHAKHEGRATISTSGVCPALAKKLPHTVYRDKNGWAWPLFSESQWKQTKNLYEGAYAVWRKFKNELRAQRRLPDKPYVPLKKKSRAGWTSETTTFFPGTPATATQIKNYQIKLRAAKKELERIEKEGRRLQDINNSLGEGI